MVSLSQTRQLHSTNARAASHLHRSGLGQSSRYWAASCAVSVPPWSSSSDPGCDAGHRWPRQGRLSPGGPRWPGAAHTDWREPVSTVSFVERLELGTTQDMDDFFLLLNNDNLLMHVSKFKYSGLWAGNGYIFVCFAFW